MAEKTLDKDKVAHLEKIFQVPARLKIMSALLARDSVDFTELIELLELTRGNLSMHMKLLNENKYVKITKKFVKNRPKTIYRITENGRSDFKTYISILEKIITELKESE
jgi:DNA-binding transcriptional ArsR family regulator